MAENEVAEAELPLDSVGARLLRAREAAGMTRAQLSAVTRIPERSLIAIEASDFAALPGRTYAVGFSRTYARAVGLDEKGIAASVRAELAAQEPAEDRRAAVTFEPGDPARVPSSKVAWLAALAAFVVLLAVYAFWRSYIAPGGSLPSLLPSEAPAPAVVQPAPAPAPASAPTSVLPTGGPVVFTALQPGVWVKFYDGAGNQLLQKELAQGESYTVPAAMPDVKLATARPDALAITIGGQGVPKLSDAQRMMKDVPVTAAALLARGSAAAQPMLPPAPAATTAPAPPRNRPAPRRTTTPASEAAAPEPAGQGATPAVAPAPAESVAAPPAA